MLSKGVQLAALLLMASTASAADYAYDGDITLCTGTCDSFAALEVASTVVGDVEIAASPSSAWGFADVGAYGFEITSSAPLEPFVGTNPTTANPLPIDLSIAVLEPTGFGGDVTGGTTDANGELDSGLLLFRFLNPPFSSNDAWVRIDVGTGTAQVCLFYATAGCVTGATEAVVVDGAFALVPPPTYNYEGDITLCTGTCDSFAALEVGSTVVGEVEIAVEPSNAWGFADVGAYGFDITSSAPLEPFVGTNPTTANPLPIDLSIAVLEPTGFGGDVTGGTTDGAGELDSGLLLFRFLNPPFSSNDAWVRIDVGTGVAQVCLFYATAGCVTGATEAVVVNGMFSLAVDVPDTDGDGIPDDVDNCTLVPNPTQLDADGDGYGNICDGDFNNNCVVAFEDLGFMKANFFTNNPLADMNGNGSVEFGDLGLLKSGFFAPPGPSFADPCTP